MPRCWFADNLVHYTLHQFTQLCEWLLGCRRFSCTIILGALFATWVDDRTGRTGSAEWSALSNLDDELLRYILNELYTLMSRRETPVHWSQTGGKERKAVDLQRAADRIIMNGFYIGLKEVWGPKKKGPFHRKSTDGMETFSDSTRVVARWSENVYKLLNGPGEIDHEALDNISQRIAKTCLDDISTTDDWARAIAGLKDCKARGRNGIPAVVWKHGAPTNHQCLGGGFRTTIMEGCHHCNHLQERWSHRLWEL